MACAGERLSAAVVERVRNDFVKAVNAVGVNVSYLVMDSIVSWGYGLSGISGVEEDPLYSQPAYPAAPSWNEGKTYVSNTVMSIVNASPTKGQLREVGLKKEVDIFVSIAALSLELLSIVPDLKVDRILVAGEEYDIIEIHKDWLMEGETSTVKNLCWSFGCIKRGGSRV